MYFYYACSYAKVDYSDFMNYHCRYCFEADTGSIANTSGISMC
ncbi:MAG: hypothetical protein ACLUTU_09230 [Blautia faecis]